MKLKIYAIKCLKMNHIFFLSMNKQISEYQSNLHVQFDQTQKVCYTKMINRGKLYGKDNPRFIIHHL